MRRFKVGDLVEDKATGTMWLLVGGICSSADGSWLVGFRALTLHVAGMDEAWRLEKVGEVQDIGVQWFEEHGRAMP